MGETKKRLLFGSIGLLIFCVCFSLAAPSAVGAAQKGKVTAVMRTGNFSMKGGDPYTPGGSLASPIVWSLYEGLVRKTNEGKVAPCLATSWEIDPAWKHMTFYLDKKAKWTDGKPVTAEDVKFSLERIMGKTVKHIHAGEHRRKIDHIEIIDDHTVRIHLTSAWPAFLDRTSNESVIIPKHYVEKVGADEFAKNPIGSGPFKFVKMQQDVYMDFEAKAEHHRKAPYIKNLTHRYVQEAATRIAMLQTGEVDVAMIAEEHIDIVNKDPNLRVVLAKYGLCRTLLFYILNHPDQPSPLHDIRVREAIAYAIDYENITKNVFHGAAEPWGNLVAPYLPGYDPNLKPHPYDTEKAKELLKAAGYPNGFSVTLNTSQMYAKDSQAVAASLSKVGIMVKLDLVEHGTWRRLLEQKKLKDMGVQITPWWGGRSHASTALSSTFDTKSKYTYNDDKELEKEFFKLAKMINEDEMAKQVKVLAKMYFEKKLRINLWAMHTSYGVRNTIKDFAVPFGRIYPVNWEYVTLNE